MPGLQASHSHPIRAGADGKLPARIRADLGHAHPAGQRAAERFVEVEEESVVAKGAKTGRDVRLLTGASQFLEGRNSNSQSLFEKEVGKIGNWKSGVFGGGRDEKKWGNAST
jgi:hypothetical protein